MNIIFTAKTIIDGNFALKEPVQILYCLHKISLYLEGGMYMLSVSKEGEWMQVLKDIRKELNDDDLGRGFYNRLKVVSPVKLIDFDNIENNTFHFTAEFTCKNGQDEFRPHHPVRKRTAASLLRRSKETK